MFFNLSDAHIEIIKPHKIVKAMSDAFKLMYEHLDKTTIVILRKKIPKLEMKDYENVTFVLAKFLSLRN